MQTVDLVKMRNFHQATLAKATIATPANHSGVSAPVSAPASAGPSPLASAAGPDDGSGIVFFNEGKQMPDHVASGLAGDEDQSDTQEWFKQSTQVGRLSVGVCKRCVLH